MAIINLELAAILPINPQVCWGDGAGSGTHILLHGSYFNEYYGYEIVAYICDEMGNHINDGCTDPIWQSNHETYDSMVQKFAEVCVSADFINKIGLFPEPDYYRGN